MTEVFCDCDCIYSSPNGKCLLEYLDIGNYGECLQFESSEEEKEREQE